MNRIGVFEKVTNGYDVSNISSAVKLADTIQPNKWYDIELRVGIDTVKCFLDGKLLMTYTEPDKLFAISGKDSASGDVIMKIVNAYSSETPVNIQLQNENVSSAKMITLLSPNLSDENSFETPEKFIPVETSLSGIAGNNFTLQVKPYSINVIRLKTNR